MKRFLFIVGALVVAFVIYGLATEQTGRVSPTPTLSQPTAAPTPAVTATVATPASTRPPVPRPTVVQQTPAVVRRTPPSPGAMTYSDKRSAEIRRIIYGCAKRSGWLIRRNNGYQQVRYGISRVVGAGDNTQAQRFMSEVQDSHILRGEGIELGPARAVVVDGRRLMESTFIIHWK